MTTQARSADGLSPSVLRPACIVPLAALAAAACASFNAPPSVAPDAAPAGDYRLDPAHTAVLWKVDHLGGLSKFVGRFDRVEGALDFDPDNPERVSLDIRIEAASVSTAVPGFAETIADKVFDAGAHPEIRFQAEGLTPTGANAAEVEGLLTLRGVTRPETLSVVYNGAKPNPLNGKQTLGVAASGAVARSDYGATVWSNFGVGDVIELEIHAEFVRDE